MLMSPLSSFIYRDGFWSRTELLDHAVDEHFGKLKRSNCGLFMLSKTATTIYLDESFTSETVQMKHSKLVSQVQHKQEYISID